jgi:hypothetical protein
MPIPPAARWSLDVEMMDTAVGVRCGGNTAGMDFPTHRVAPLIVIVKPAFQQSTDLMGETYNQGLKYRLILSRFTHLVKQITWWSRGDVYTPSHRFMQVNYLPQSVPPGLLEPAIRR